MRLTRSFPRDINDSSTRPPDEIIVQRFGVINRSRDKYLTEVPVYFAGYAYARRRIDQRDTRSLFDMNYSRLSADSIIVARWLPCTFQSCLEYLYHLRLTPVHSSSRVNKDTNFLPVNAVAEITGWSNGIRFRACFVSTTKNPAIATLYGSFRTGVASTKQTNRQ